MWRVTFGSKLYGKDSMFEVCGSKKVDKRNVLSYSDDYCYDEVQSWFRRY